MAQENWKSKSPPKMDAWYTPPPYGDPPPAPTFSEGLRSWSNFKQWWNSWSVLDPLPIKPDPELYGWLPDFNDPYRWTVPETMTTEEIRHPLGTNFPTRYQEEEYFREIFKMQRELKHCYGVHQANSKMACGLLERRYVDMVSTYNLMEHGFFKRLSDKENDDDDD